MEKGQEILQRLYRGLQYIRRVEEEIARVYPTDKIKSPVHLSIGQEAVAVGVCDPLNPSDIVAGTYRGHAAYLAKNGDLNAMIAELYGKATGCAAGKGGSMHLVDMKAGFLGASAVVGTTVSVALGYALALKREGKGRVAVSFFGDGATEEGCFYECLNFASLHKIPLLFICENNHFAIHTPLEKRWANPGICQRVAGFAIPTARITDSDVLEIRRQAGEFIEKMRTPGYGPAFMEIHTYRWLEHVGPKPDFDQGYRSIEELKPWQETDQVTRIGAMIDADARKAIDDKIEAEIAAALEFAENSPEPEKEALYTHVYAS